MSKLLLFSPAQASSLLTVLCIFFLRVTAGYAVAWLLSKLSKSAAVRFIIWLLFLLTSATYWMHCVGRLMWTELHPSFVASSDKALHSVTLPAHAIEPLGFVLSWSAICYILVVIGLAIARIVGSLKLRAVLRKRIPPPEGIASDFQGLAQSMRAPSCQLWLMPGLPSPASFGWLKAAVYLPVEDSLLEHPQLHDVFWHELTHIRRRDALWDILTRFARAILCFHPAIHRAVAEARLERELACDLSVVRQDPTHRHRYADTLVHFGWKSSIATERDHLKVAFAAQATTLSKRIRIILNGEQRTSMWSKTARGFAGTATLWSFAAVIPLLWVSFGVRVVGSVTSPSYIPFQNQRAQAKAHRLIQITHVQANAADQSLVPKAASPLAFPPLVPAQHDEGRPHYTLMPSADAPMSDNPEADQIASDSDSQRTTGSGASLPGRQSAPSKSAVLIDAAGQLAQMGIGRGGDRDHGHD